MKSLLAGSLLLLAANGSSWRDWPARVERWLFNARERTEQGVDAIAEGDLAAATGPFDAAARLDPENPVTRFNAGTARLLAAEEGAVEQLEQAATLAPAELLPRTLYNLGNAQLAAEQPAAAIEAYKNALRLDPAQLDAKHNLELALQALEQQQSEQGDDQETPDGENEGEQEQSPSPGAEQPPEDEQPSEDQQQSPSQDPEGQPEPQQDRQRPLPNFEDQPNMTAEQAAEILEAVENLEREQRQQQAAERLNARQTGDRDW